MNALNNEMEVYRKYWQLVQNRQKCISELLYENFIFWLLIQHKDTQIAEYKRTVHRLIVYNNNIEC